MSQACFVNNNVCLRWFLELYSLSSLKVLTLQCCCFFGAKQPFIWSIWQHCLKLPGKEKWTGEVLYVLLHTFLLCGKRKITVPAAQASKWVSRLTVSAARQAVLGRCSSALSPCDSTHPSAFFPVPRFSPVMNGSCPARSALALRELRGGLCPQEAARRRQAGSCLPGASRGASSGCFVASRKTGEPVPALGCGTAPPSARELRLRSLTPLRPELGRRGSGMQSRQSPGQPRPLPGGAQAQRVSTPGGSWCCCAEQNWVSVLSFEKLGNSSEIILNQQRAGLRCKAKHTEVRSSQHFMVNCDNSSASCVPLLGHRSFLRVQPLPCLACKVLMWKRCN